MLLAMFKDHAFLTFEAIDHVLLYCWRISPYERFES